MLLFILHVWSFLGVSLQDNVFSVSIALSYGLTGTGFFGFSAIFIMPINQFLVTPVLRHTIHASGISCSRKHETCGGVGAPLYVSVTCTMLQEEVASPVHR